MSLALNTDYVNSQWEAVTEGAQTGRTVSRSAWRLVRDVYIAETDEEARHKALNGMLARVWRDYLIPLFKQLTFLPSMKHDPEIPDEAVTPEYMADHLWLIGSPETVASKIRKLYTEVGGLDASWSWCTITGRTRRDGSSHPSAGRGGHAAPG